MFQRGILALLILVLFLSPLTASALTFELTPFVGYRFASDFDIDANFIEPVDLELDEGTSSGIILGFDVTNNLQVELIWSRQETELLETGGFFLNDDSELFDIDVNYYHAGVAYQWKLGQVRPFVAASLGWTEFDPDAADLSSETEISFGLGGGVKLMFSKNLGLRFEGRLLATALDDDDDRCRNCYDDDDSLTQGEIRGGLILAF